MVIDRTPLLDRTSPSIARAATMIEDVKLLETSRGTGRGGPAGRPGLFPAQGIYFFFSGANVFSGTHTLAQCQVEPVKRFTT
jgi:hypothetical protein